MCKFTAQTVLIPTSVYYLHCFYRAVIYYSNCFNAPDSKIPNCSKLFQYPQPKNPKLFQNPYINQSGPKILSNRKISNHSKIFILHKLLKSPYIYKNVSIMSTNFYLIDSAYIFSNSLLLWLDLNYGKLLTNNIVQVLPFSS